MQSSQNWRSCILGDVITLQRGFDLPERERRLGDIPIVSSSGVTGHHNIAKVKGPGVVTGRYGTLGQVFYIKGRFWPLNTTLFVQDFKGNNPLFISYFLRTLNLAQQDSAGAVPGVNRNALHLMPVHIPSIPIQHIIANILSVYDNLIENNTRRITILEEMAQMLYQEWFVKFRFPGYEKVEMVESALGMIPQRWDVVPISSACHINPTTRVPKEGEKVFVPMNSLSNNSMLIDSIELREGNNGSKFKNADTLFARITPCLENGKIGYVQFLPASDAVAFGSTEFVVLRSKTLCSYYVYLMARTDAFRDHAIKSMSGASGRQRVQMACFDSFFIAQPDNHFLLKFEEIVAPIFRQIHILSQKNTILRQARDMLLPKLISGELDVSSWVAEDVEEMVGELAQEYELAEPMVRRVAEARVVTPIERDGLEQTSLWG